MLCVVRLSVTIFYFYAECHYVECRYTECRQAECRYAECCGAMEGTTEKMLQFMMPLKLIRNKNLGFIEQKMFFEHYRVVLTINLLIDIVFVMAILF